MAKTFEKSKQMKTENDNFKQYSKYDYKGLQKEIEADIIRHKDKFDFKEILSSILSRYSDTILNNSLHHQTFLISKIAESHEELDNSLKNEARSLSKVSSLSAEIKKLSNKLDKNDK